VAFSRGSLFLRGPTIPTTSTPSSAQPAPTWLTPFNECVPAVDGITTTLNMAAAIRISVRQLYGEFGSGSKRWRCDFRGTLLSRSVFSFGAFRTNDFAEDICGVNVSCAYEMGIGAKCGCGVGMS
jgi:hypothetical protein